MTVCASFTVVRQLMTWVRRSVDGGSLVVSLLLAGGDKFREVCFLSCGMSIGVRGVVWCGISHCIGGH